MDEPPIICVVGSRELDLGEVAGPVLKHLVSFPPGTIVMVRGRRSGASGRFEQMVTRLCTDLAIPVRVEAPDGSGREATYARDVRMVNGADAVLAFFAADHVMEGGTGHVVEKALDAQIPVWGWEVTGKGLEPVGSAQ